jgi:apolipoprotein N-acyltransferase
LNRFTKKSAWLVFLPVLLLSPAWYFAGGFITMFVGFVPLLLIEDNIRSASVKNPKIRFFGYVYASLFLWNLATTWWVWNASLGGAIGMLIANTLLMSIPWILFSQVKKMVGLQWGLVSLVVFWLAFEYVHLNWDLSWSWLNLGNGFAYSTPVVQWYEYTGVLGGTLWVLILNVLFFGALKNGFSKKKIYIMALAVFLPIFISLLMYLTYTEKGEKVEIVVVQPNIDPYNEKFSSHANFIPYEKQADIFLNLVKQKISPQTELIVFPETAFDEDYLESNIQFYTPIRKLKNFLNENNNWYMLGGVVTLDIYGKEKKTPTARPNKQVGFYDVFNTAMFLNNAVDSVALYHKSKLVPLVESMPYPSVIETVLGSLIIDLGGSTGGLGQQREREVFFSKKFGYAPIICYESVYGEYVTEYVQKGANILCIITNDGWWGDTPGHRQHWQMARLRAIETRRAVARSANTGISGFISQKGEILEKTDYWTRDVRVQTLQANTQKTLYVILGDYLGKIALGFSVMIILYALGRKRLLKQ